MRDMATSAGLAALKPNISAFEAMQTKSLLPQHFRGSVRAAGELNGGVRLSVEVATPCALVVHLTRKQLNGGGHEPSLPSLATDDEHGTLAAAASESPNGNRAPPPDPDVEPSPPAPLTPPSPLGPGPQPEPGPRVEPEPET